jgi:dsDNA-binding SOS-regulon protein
MEQEKKERFTTILNPSQLENLRLLSSTTRIKMAEHVREALDLLFAKYREELKKAKKKRGG